MGGAPTPAPSPANSVQVSSTVPPASGSIVPSLAGQLLGKERSKEGDIEPVVMETQTTTVLLASQVSDSGLGPRSGSFNSDITPEYWKDPLLGITMYSWQWITFAVLLVYCCCCCCVGICGGLYAYQKKRKKRNMA